MRKIITLFAFAAALLFMGAPAYAQNQHGGHGGNRGGGQHGARGNRGGRRGNRDFRGTGRRMEEGRFREGFGREHGFIIGERGFGWRSGYNSFFFGGMYFGLLDPWPIGWAYTDGVYVEDVDGGYVLVNPTYPGITVGLTIVP